MKKLLLLPGGVLVLALLVLLVMPREPENRSPRIEQLAEQRSASQQGSEQLRISSADLPPEGTRSLFDHLLSENGGLPYPFDQLMQMLASYDVEGRQPHNLLIPDGRSLLKADAHFGAPRIVVAADARAAEGATHAPRLRGRLFLGFVEEAAEIEVISYNEKAGRFEFQLVENYCEACVPRIVYARRAICTTCHAGGAPIFPVRPWDETNVNPEISRRLAAQLEGETYFSAPLDRQLEDGQRFDDLTDMANVIPTAQRIWLQGCGVEGQACRRQLLELALDWAVNPTILDQRPQAVAKLRQLQAASWPAAGIELANSDLNNRDPLQSALYEQSWWQRVRQLLRPQAEPQMSDDKLRDFEQLPALPPALDPLTPRPAKQILDASQLDGVYMVAQMFSRADIAWLEALAAYDPARLREAVASLSELYFAPEPLQRVAMLDALGAALGATARAYCCADTSTMSPPRVQGVPPLQLAGDSVLQPFETYCFACHRGNPAARLDFMSGDTEQAVLARIRETDSIREVLDYQRYLGSAKAGSLMPPEDSWQREALEEALARGEDPLSAMREQVPALFEF